jgi:signal transduction histidine kinase
MARARGGNGVQSSIRVDAAPVGEATAESSRGLALIDALLAGDRDQRRVIMESLPSFSPSWQQRLLAMTAIADDARRSDRELQQRIAHAKVEAIKEFAYGAGHEINNPLANISARAQTLLRDETHPERRRTLATINRQAFRAHEMIADLMLFARPPELQRELFDAGAATRQVVDELLPVASAQATTLNVSVEGGELPLTIWADPVQFAVVVKAVVSNAIEALGAGGTVDVQVRPAAREKIVETLTDDATAFDLTLPHESQQAEPSGDSVGERIRLPQVTAEAAQVVVRPGVEIIVTDDGPGLSEREREHLFDPFFSGREAGRGLGFGLCKAWRIVTEHGGTIRVSSPLGDRARGTSIRLWLASNA